MMNDTNDTKVCVITNDYKDIININFIGDKEFMINCIFKLIEVYKSDFEKK